MPMHQSVREVVENLFGGCGFETIAELILFVYRVYKVILLQIKPDAKANDSFHCPNIAHFIIGLFSDDSRLEELKTLLPSTEAASQFKLCPIDFEKVPLMKQPQFSSLKNC